MTSAANWRRRNSWEKYLAMRQYKMVTVNCEQCGHPFDVRVFERKRGRGRFCSHTCTAKATTRPQYGEANPNWKGGISTNHYRYKKLQIQRYPERVRASSLLCSAVRAGKVTRGSCTVCGEPNAQGHHEDYSLPLEVVWLYAKHHREIHRKQ